MSQTVNKRQEDKYDFFFSFFLVHVHLHSTHIYSQKSDSDSSDFISEFCTHKILEFQNNFYFLL